MRDDDVYTDFQRRVRAVVAAIPSGEVMTYGEVAEEAGYPGAARAVGTTMRDCSRDVPWWRVVRANGALASQRPSEQAKRLRREDVLIVENTVVGLRT